MLCSRVFWMVAERSAVISLTPQTPDLSLLARGLARSALACTALLPLGGLRVLHVHVLDGAIERSDPLEAAAPILQMPPRPQDACFLVAPPDRVKQMAMRPDKARSALRDTANDHFSGREEQLRSRLAGKLQHPVLRRLADQNVEPRVKLGSTGGITDHLLTALKIVGELGDDSPR